MTDVTDNQGQASAELTAADEQLLRELTERARSGGLKLTGEGGLLGKLTKMVVEGALEGELDDHLGYAKHDPAGRNGGNSRNGYRDKTVLTEAGPVELSVPRDRDASFEPRIVAKKQRRLTGIDNLVISLLVTPDGDLVRAGAGHEPDLLWARPRGRGLGVVIALGGGGPGGAPGPRGELRAADRAQGPGPGPYPPTVISPAGPAPEATRTASWPKRRVRRARTGEKYRLKRPAPGSGPPPAGPRITPMV